MSLKAAVGWSILIHLGLLVMRAPVSSTPADPALPIKVTYVAVPKPIHAPLKKGPPVSAAPADPKPVQVQRAAPPAPKPAPPAPKPVGVKIPAPEPTVSVSTAPSGTISSLPDSDFAAIQHKQQTRQHLKARLNFPPEGIPGIVRLRLILSPEGKIQELTLLEASDSGLGQAALQGARSGEPYPPFPKDFKAPSARYEFLVQYRLE